MFGQLVPIYGHGLPPSTVGLLLCKDLLAFGHGYTKVRLLDQRLRAHVSRSRQPFYLLIQDLELLRRS